MNVTEYVKAECGPPCSKAKIGSTGEILAIFRTSIGWKIDEKILQGLMLGLSVIAEGIRNDLDDMDPQTGRYVRNGRSWHLGDGECCLPSGIWPRL